MAQIEVSHVGDSRYMVEVTEGPSRSTHQVTVRADDLQRLGGGSTAEGLIAASFRFLLDRETKESILSEFDLSVIGRYFPEYPDRIGDYL
jgi:hypothetical protein